MPTINGAHAIIFSTNAEADRAFLRDVLGLPNVDAGDGWLIFGLPPSEVAVHPGERNDTHELYLMCEDIQGFLTDLAQRNIDCEPVQDQGWGLVSKIRLPGGGNLPVYQPRHARPESPTSADAQPRRKPARAANARKRKPAGRAKAASKKAAGKKPSKKAGKRKR